MVNVGYPVVPGCGIEIAVGLVKVAAMGGR